MARSRMSLFDSNESWLLIIAYYVWPNFLDVVLVIL